MYITHLLHSLTFQHQLPTFHSALPPLLFILYNKRVGSRDIPQQRNLIKSDFRRLSFDQHLFMLVFNLHSISKPTAIGYKSAILLLHIANNRLVRRSIRTPLLARNSRSEPHHKHIPLYDSSTRFVPTVFIRLVHFEHRSQIASFVRIFRIVGEFLLLLLIGFVFCFVLIRVRLCFGCFFRIRIRIRLCLCLCLCSEWIRWRRLRAFFRGRRELREGFAQ